MFGNTSKELEEAFNEKPTVSNPVEAVVIFADYTKEDLKKWNG